STTAPNAAAGRLAQPQPPDLGKVGVRHQPGRAERALPALRLLGEDVALHGMTALDLAGGGQLEALDGPPLALELQLLFRLSHFIDPPPHPSDVSPHVGGGIAGFIRCVPCPLRPRRPEPSPERGSWCSCVLPAPWP